MNSDKFKLLTEKKELLYLHKKNLESQLKKTENDIQYNLMQISMECSRVNNGHIWITEREEGPYGERFTYCKVCKINNYLDYHHL